MSLEQQVIAWLAQQDLPVYLVGGTIRDRLLRRSIYDLDLAVAGDGLRLARRLSNHFDGDYYPLDSERSTGRAILYTVEGSRLIVDVARLRGHDARDLAADLADRDFTINALAADVRAPDAIIDLHGGQADLRAGLIRPVSPDAIRNDPLRALRAVRQAAQLGFTLAPETERLMRRHGAGLADVSAERVRDELSRLLARPDAAPWLHRLDDLGLLVVVFPELASLRGVEQPPPHHLDVLAHSLAAVSALEDILAYLSPGVGQDTAPPLASLAELLPFAGRVHAHLARETGHNRPGLVILKLALLLHDIGKPASQTVDDDGRIRFLGHPCGGAGIAAEALRRLRFDRAEAQLVETIVRHHMRPLLLAAQSSVSSRAVYRFFRDTRQAGVDVVLHALADHRATYAPGAPDPQGSRLVALAARMLANYWDRQSLYLELTPLLSGRDLLRAFDLAPGPHIGDLLEIVREAQALGEIHTRDEALSLVKEHLE
ncbi:MAG: HD domain-containing protein [Anaerolineae bacterium]|jgi:poly(A) polymerase/tRNA nucleotidyltransferase (CCA-adding enzyme)